MNSSFLLAMSKPTTTLERVWPITCLPSAENQTKVNEIKAELDNAKTAAEGIDDGYEPPIVEPSPFSPADDGSVAGSAQANTVEDTTTDSKARGKR